MGRKTFDSLKLHIRRHVRKEKKTTVLSHHTVSSIPILFSSSSSWRVAMDRFDCTYPCNPTAEIPKLTTKRTCWSRVNKFLSIAMYVCLFLFPTKWLSSEDLYRPSCRPQFHNWRTNPFYTLHGALIMFLCTCATIDDQDQPTECFNDSWASHP